MFSSTVYYSEDLFESVSHNTNPFIGGDYTLIPVFPLSLEHVFCPCTKHMMPTLFPILRISVPLVLLGGTTVVVVSVVFYSRGPIFGSLGPNGQRAIGISAHVDNYNRSCVFD